MSASNLHDSLLRPPVIQILHATGFCFAHPAVIDTLTDFAARYLLLLASTTLAHALKRHAENPTPSLDEVLLTLQDVGALELQKPQVEEELDGVEGMRGLESFLAWFSGPVNAEVMRAAGFVPSESDDEEEDMLKEDYVTALVKGHPQLQSTILGGEMPCQPVAIRGGVKSIREWREQLIIRSRELSVKSASVSPETISADTLDNQTK